MLQFATLVFIPRYVHFPHIMAALSPREKDLQSMLAAQVHIGCNNADSQMRPYIWRCRNDGIHILNIGETYQSECPRPLSLHCLHVAAGALVLSVLAAGLPRDAGSGAGLQAFRYRHGALFS